MRLLSTSDRSGDVRISFKSLIIIVMCNLFITHKSMSDVIYNSEWTNPDGSKSESIVTFYENVGLQGMLGYYSGSQRNRLIGQFNSEQTVFDGYWVQDESGQQCPYQIDSSEFYGRLFIKLNAQKEFEGLWSYCDEPPYLPWQGRLKQKIGIESKIPKSVDNTKKQIQIALNYFGYHVGVADGVFGKKTINAITQIQYCWEEADPYALFVRGTLEFGTLDEAQQAFLLRSHEEAKESGLNSAGCIWFEQLAGKNVKASTDSLSNEMNDSFCNYEGDIQDPVFYCSFENGKQVKVCETYSEDGMWNSFIYSYGIIGGNPELELYSEIKSSYFPEVVATTSIDFLKPSCAGEDGYPCETNHTMRYDFADTKGQLIFSNNEYEYIINTSSTLGARDRVFDGSLVVNELNKSLPEYDPNFRKKLTSLDCDLGSTYNSVWDGLYVDNIVINEGLCFVNSIDEGAGWETCLP